MSTRLTTYGYRLNAWIEARATDRMLAYAQRAEDALTIERDKVRTLTSQLADRAETIDHLNEEIDEMQTELAALYRAHRRLEIENDNLRGEVAGTSVADEVEAFLAHPSQGGES